MPDNKQLCKSYKKRHPPPTGKKCKQNVASNGLLRDAAVADLSAVGRGQGSSSEGQSVQLAILEQLQKIAAHLDQVEGQMAASSQGSTQV